MGVIMKVVVIVADIVDTGLMTMRKLIVVVSGLI